MVRHARRQPASWRPPPAVIGDLTFEQYRSLPTWCPLQAMRPGDIVPVTSSAMAWLHRSTGPCSGPTGSTYFIRLIGFLIFLPFWLAGYGSRPVSAPARHLVASAGSLQLRDCLLDCRRYPFLISIAASLPGPLGRNLAAAGRLSAPPSAGDRRAFPACATLDRPPALQPERDCCRSKCSQRVGATAVQLPTRLYCWPCLEALLLLVWRLFTPLGSPRHAGPTPHANR